MKERLKQLITQNKTEKVIHQLLQVTKKLEDKDLLNEVILQSARFKEHQRSSRLGASTFNEKRISIADILKHPWMTKPLPHVDLTLDFKKMRNFSKFSKVVLSLSSSKPSL